MNIAAIALTLALANPAQPVTNPALENRCLQALTSTYIIGPKTPARVALFTRTITAKFGTPCKAMKALNARKVHY